MIVTNSYMRSDPRMKKIREQQQLVHKGIEQHQRLMEQRRKQMEQRRKETEKQLFQMKAKKRN